MKLMLVFYCVLVTQCVRHAYALEPFAETFSGSGPQFEDAGIEPVDFFFNVPSGWNGQGQYTIDDPGEFGIVGFVKTIGEGEFIARLDAINIEPLAGDERSDFQLKMQNEFPGEPSANLEMKLTHNQFGGWELLLGRWDGVEFTLQRLLNLGSDSSFDDQDGFTSFSWFVTYDESNFIDFEYKFEYAINGGEKKLLGIVDDELWPFTASEFRKYEVFVDSNGDHFTSADYDFFSVQPLSSQSNCDFNGDGTVNFADFVMFSNAFNQSSGGDNEKFDKNGDGTVNFPDFVEFSNRFGEQVAGVLTVPEPIGCHSVLMALIFLRACRRMDMVRSDVTQLRF